MSELLIKVKVLPIVGETAKSPYRRLKPLRYVAIGLLLLAIVANFGGQLSLGYSLLGVAFTALTIWAFSEIMSRARE